MLPDSLPLLPLLLSLPLLSLSLLHCPNNNLNLCTKTVSVRVGADTTVYVWFLGQIFVCDRLGFNARFRLCFGQWTGRQTIIIQKIFCLI